MIDDREIRDRLAEAGIRPNPAPATRGISSKSGRRGSSAFDDLMEELEDEWELDEEELDNIVEIRRTGDGFEVRFKGEDRWVFLEDDGEDQDTDDEDGTLGPGEDSGGEEE